MQNQEKEERERWIWLLLVGIGMFFTDRLLAWTVYSIRLLYLVPLLVSGVYFLYLCIQISRHKLDRRKCNQLEVWMMEAKRWMLSGFWLSFLGIVVDWIFLRIFFRSDQREVYETPSKERDVP